MIDKKLELSKNIVEYLPIINEYFIKFYGEEYRDVIKERFDNCTYIGYYTPDDIKHFLYDLDNNKSEELISSFLEKNGIVADKENIDKYFYCKDLKFESIINLSVLYDCLDNGIDSSYRRDNFLKILQGISNNNNLEYNTDEFNSVIEKIISMRSSYEEMLKEFKNFSKNYDGYRNYVDSCSKLETKIRDKYQNIYLREIYEYLSVHDKEIIDNNKDIYYFDLDCYGILCSSYYGSQVLIDSFSSENEKKISSSDTREYIIKSICDDRIRYFNKLGINLGNNYEDYIKDERCLKLRPDVEMVDKIINIREELSDKEEEEYLISTSGYREQLEKIEKLNFIDKNIAYNYKGVSNGLTCINPNIIKKDGKIQLYSLFLFSANNFNEYFDKTLIHEFNHLAETDLISADDESYVVRCGWDILNCKINDSDENNEKREFEYLNEIINELLCQEITKMIHDDGIYLFDDKENSRIRGGTSYERSRFLVQGFYDEFKDVIKYSRITGDMDSLYKIIGQDNLMELNGLIRDFFDYFSEFKVYNLIEELDKKLETDNVQFYYKCIERRDKIFSRMKDKRLEYEDNNSFVK